MGRRRRARQRWATIPQVPRKRRKTHPSARSTPRLRMRSKTNTPPSAPLSLSLSLFSLSLSLILAGRTEFKNNTDKQQQQTPCLKLIVTVPRIIICIPPLYRDHHRGHRLPRPPFFPKAPRSSPTTT